MPQSCASLNRSAGPWLTLPYHRRLYDGSAAEDPSGWVAPHLCSTNWARRLQVRSQAPPLPPAMQRSKSWYWRSLLTLPAGMANLLGASGLHGTGNAELDKAVCFLSAPQVGLATYVASCLSAPRDKTTHVPAGWYPPSWLHCPEPATGACPTRYAVIGPGCFRTTACRKSSETSVTPRWLCDARSYRTFHRLELNCICTC